MIDSYDANKFVKDEVTQKVHRAAVRALPEIGMMPHALMEGTGYETPVLIKRPDDEIFVPIGEGALSSKGDYDMVSNKAMQVQFKVEGNKLAIDQSTGKNSPLAGRRRFAQETTDRYSTAFERIVKQLYLGTDQEEHGFKGFPDAVKYKIDASKGDWNLDQDFDWTAPTDAARLYSVYLLRVAASTSLEEEGAKWIWANNQTIEPTGSVRTYDIKDDEKSSATGKNATSEGLIQYHAGGVGFGFTSAVDVVEIANVPSFRVADFYLDNVIAQALDIFPNGGKANRIVIQKLCQKAMWLNVQNQNAGDRNVSIVAPKDEGEMSIMTPYFFDGTEEIPLVVSDVMPATGLQTDVSTDGISTLSEVAYVD